MRFGERSEPGRPQADSATWGERMRFGERSEPGRPQAEMVRVSA